MLARSIPFGDVCSRLNRPQVYVRGLQKRLNLPVLENSSYPAPYVSFLEIVTHLRVLGVSEEALVRLWAVERKLMELLHADSTGSPTWFLDACGSKGKQGHRLLLSNFDIGAFLPSGTVQLGLDFAGKTTPELFSGSEMGEDAILVLRQYLHLHQQIVRDIQLEVPILRAALRQIRLPQRMMPADTTASP